MEHLLAACNRGKLDMCIPAVTELVLENVTMEELDKDMLLNKFMTINVFKVYPSEIRTLAPKMMPRMWWVKGVIHEDPQSDRMSVITLIAEASNFMKMIEVIFNSIITLHVLTTL